jgi:hypothetical protein
MIAATYFKNKRRVNIQYCTNCGRAERFDSREIKRVVIWDVKRFGGRAG